MPKPGYVSVTFPKPVIQRYETIYQKSKSQLQLEGISSFTGFLTSRLSKQLELDENND